MARGHRLNISIVLAAVHGLSGLFRAVSAVEPSLFRPLPTLSPSLISHLASVDVKQNILGHGHGHDHGHGSLVPGTEESRFDSVPVPYSLRPLCGITLRRHGFQQQAPEDGVDVEAEFGAGLHLQTAVLGAQRAHGVTRHALLVREVGLVAHQDCAEFLRLCETAKVTITAKTSHYYSKNNNNNNNKTGLWWTSAAL